jgi:Secretion system C-terminal sorting domain/Reeler domain
MKIQSIFSFIILVTVSSFFISYSSGQSDDFAGAPSEGSCINCHSGATIGSSIALTGMPTSYSPGQAYTLTLTVNDATKVRSGFQIVATDGSNGTQIGNFSMLPSGTQLTAANRLIHDSPQNFVSGTASWTFKWTAPSVGAPANVVFYYAAVAGNNMNGSSGDKVHKGNSGNISVGIELVAFNTTIQKDNQVKLDWQTATETDNKHFVVERKTDGMPFYQEVSTIKGHGTTTETQKYSFTDAAPELGKINYYRLRQEDFDGKTTYSKVLSVALKTSFKINVYPNIVKNGDVLTIDAIGSSDKAVQVDVVNMSGQVVQMTKNAAYTEGVQFPVNNLAAGRYIVKVRNSDKQNYASFVVQ